MECENETRFDADRFAVADLDGVDLLVVVIKGTYVFDDRGRVEIADEQCPIELVDSYAGEPGESSIAYASDFAIGKKGTDVAVLGHAYPMRPGDTEVNVGIEIGPVQKLVRVFGDRYWGRAMGITRMSSPRSFERIPLVFERAFGGADKSHPDEKHHEYEPRNPSGVGFRARKSKMPVDESPLPNFEDPRNLISSPDDRPPPAGLGFIGPAWQPRLGYAGTYGEEWEESRKPLLPADFDVRFFNAAHPDLACPGFLSGREELTAIGLSPDGPIKFVLPGARPACRAQGDGIGEIDIPLDLHKVVLEPDERRLLLVWGGSLRMQGAFHDISLVRFSLLN